MNIEDKREAIQSIAYKLIEFVIDETSRNQKHVDYKYEFANQIANYIGNLSDANIDTLFDVVCVALSDETDNRLHRVMFQVFESLEMFDIDTSSQYQVVDFYEDLTDADAEAEKVLIDYCVDELKSEPATLL